MNVRSIALASIDVGFRLRALDPAWVALLKEEIDRDGQLEAIRVVQHGARFKLIAGASRIAAQLARGCEKIDARIEPESALATEAALKLAEIKADMMRRPLTVLERAIYVAAWREVYESVNPLPKRGRKPKSEIRPNLGNISGAAANDDQEDPFLLSLTEAAKRALGLSRMALHRALKIAAIDRDQAHRLIGHPSADNQTELLHLAEQSGERQSAILDLLTVEPAEAATVADAIAMLDRAPTVPKPSPYERIHQTFARLPEPQQHAFFELNTEAIERWQAARASKSRSRRAA